MDLIDGCVYKYYCKDSSVHDFYIGSTIDFKRRRWEHRANAKCEKITKKNRFKLYDCIKLHGGKNNWEFEMLLKGKFTSIKELKKQEGQFIKLLKPSLNMVIPNRTKKEYYEDNKDKILKRKKEMYWIKKNNLIFIAKLENLIEEHLESCENMKI